MRLVIGLIVGGIIVAMVWFLQSWFRGKVPEKELRRPEPTLTEETKEKIREEIHSDTDRELIERILRKLDRGKS